jgi:coenzyme F420 hydrogenase subunit beta
VPYPEIFEHLGRETNHPLLGPHLKAYIGHSLNSLIRRRAASGGVTTSMLLHLLEIGEILGAVVLQQGREAPERASAFIATTPEEIVSCAQSVYSVTPALHLLPEMERFPGPLALVGLPEQVAVVRMLQAAGHPAVRNVKFVLGLYTGTNMYSGAVRAFLRANGAGNDIAIRRLQWRAGEWPGHLEVETDDGRVFRADKFHYNYLIPFFISRNSLITPDFANETADISVGDAWSPLYERRGGGYSVVVSRSTEMERILGEMQTAGKLELREIDEAQAISMHAHMIEFKKRGSAIRRGWQRRRGQPTPEFGYRPEHIPLSRILVESVIALIFALGRSRLGRWMAVRVPVSVAGRLFELLRQSWKSVSKPVKRQGLAAIRFIIEPNPGRWLEILSLRKQP